MIFATGYGRGGGHLIHRNGHGHDGAIVIDPLSAKPRFLLFRFGYIPSPGDTATHETHTFTVQEMDRNRIARVKIVTARPEPESITAS